jgi:hypothetical protein
VAIEQGGTRNGLRSVCHGESPEKGGKRSDEGECGKINP